MNAQTIALLIAAAAAGYFIGKRRAEAGDTSPTASNEIRQQQDWWTYAGSWA